MGKPSSLAQTYLPRGAGGFWEDSVLGSIGFELRFLLKFPEASSAPEGIDVVG